MPWKETTTIEQKIEFICEWRAGKYTITDKDVLIGATTSLYFNLAGLKSDSTYLLPGTST